VRGVPALEHADESASPSELGPTSVSTSASARAAATLAAVAVMLEAARSVGGRIWDADDEAQLCVTRQI
jgi:hypothetical protein